MMNILIYYMHETDLRMMSYGMMNMGTCDENLRDLGENRGQPAGIQIWIGASPETGKKAAKRIAVVRTEKILLSKSLREL